MAWVVVCVFKHRDDLLGGDISVSQVGFADEHDSHVVRLFCSIGWHDAMFETCVKILASCPSVGSISLSFMLGVRLVYVTLELGDVAWQINDGSKLLVDEMFEGDKRIRCVC